MARVVFMGTAEFAVPALRAVAPHVLLVVSQPDRPTGRGMKLAPSPVSLVALELGLEVAKPEKARDPEFVQRIRDLEPDILLVAAYGQLLSMSLLESAKFGGINLHGSILPKYRGAAPIQRAILEAESETGVTLMQMAKGMDTGDMIAVAETPIGPEETYGELASRLGDIAGELAKDWLERLCAGDYPRAPQDDAQATHAAKVEKAEARLDFVMTAHEAHRRYRAFTPSPGASLITRFGPMRISAAKLRQESGELGTVLAPGIVAFREGSLELREIQPEGKKRMSGADAMNGWRLRPGDSIRVDS